MTMLPSLEINTTNGLSYPRWSDYAHFRTLDGRPICFWCKRIGHVKKYCRFLNLNQNWPIKLGQSQKLENAVRKVDVEQTKEEHSCPDIGKLLLKLRSLTAENTNASSDPRFFEEDFDELQGTLYQNALLQATQKIAQTSRTLRAKRRAEVQTGSVCVDVLDPVGASSQGSNFVQDRSSRQDNDFYFIDRNTLFDCITKSYNHVHLHCCLFILPCVVLCCFIISC